MPAPAVDPRPHRTPKALGGLAALACVACCALPVLITAGVVGTGAGVVVSWLPAIAVSIAWAWSPTVTAPTGGTSSAPWSASSAWP